jgi:hypothetical protein
MIRRVAVRTLALAVGLLLLANVAYGAEPLRVICFVDAKPSAHVEQGYAIDVRLLVTQTQPVPGAMVHLYDVVDLLGSRDMFVGMATTDDQGHASFIYLPAQTGTHELVARFAGMPGYAATEGRTTLQATVAAKPYVVEPAPLASFTSKVPYAVAALVLAVWGLIGFALIGTARGVIDGARNNKVRKGDTA